MDSRAIGIFDSGLGGLTAIRSLRKLLPQEHIIFLGDTARLPYGSRLPDTIREFARNDMNFLYSKGIKCLGAACGTVSSNIQKTDLNIFPCTFVGLIDSTANAAVKATANRKVGVIGTEATIASGSFRKAINKLDNEITVYSKSCPDFVPLIEGGFVTRDKQRIYDAAREYLSPIIAGGVDTLILGCTHYPLISGIISEIVGDEVTLIDSGAEEARAIEKFVRENDLLSESREGSCEFYVTSDTDRFSRLAKLFLGCAEEINVKLVTEKEFSKYHI